MSEMFPPGNPEGIESFSPALPSHGYAGFSFHRIRAGQNQIISSE
jgi:hypothetical protein